MFRKYLATLYETFEAKMSGTISLAFSVVATYSTFFIGDTGLHRSRVYLWIGGALSFIYANYKIWAVERSKRTLAEDALASRRSNLSMYIEAIYYNYFG